MAYKLKLKERSGFVDVIPPCSPDLSCGMVWVRREHTTNEQAIMNHIAKADVNAWMLTGPAHGWMEYDKWREMMVGQGWEISWMGHSILLDILQTMNHSMYEKLTKSNNQEANDENPDSL